MGLTSSTYIPQPPDDEECQYFNLFQLMVKYKQCLLALQVNCIGLPTIQRQTFDMFLNQIMVTINFYGDGFRNRNGNIGPFVPHALRRTTLHEIFYQMNRFTAPKDGPWVCIDNYTLELLDDFLDKKLGAKEETIMELKKVFQKDETDLPSYKSVVG